MPITPTYPGVYVEELPSGVRTITGVATSITAFIGFAPKGPTNEPTRIQNFGSYERIFGGLSRSSTMSYAVQQFFMNGGGDAIIVRLENNKAKKAKYEIDTDDRSKLKLQASSIGEWGNNLQITVDYKTAISTTPEQVNEDKTFNLTIKLVENDKEIVTESILNLSLDPNSTRFIKDVLEVESSLVRVEDYPPMRIDNGKQIAPRPTASKQDSKGKLTPLPAPIGDAKGDDGDAIVDNTSITLYKGSKDSKTGIYALEKADLFNILCIPPATRTGNIDNSIWTEAVQYCLKRRAFLLVDSPNSWTRVDQVVAGADVIRQAVGDAKKNSALFFPRVKLADPLKENRLDTFVPCGIIAGLFARTDANRGVWKAPAVTEASLNGVRELPVKLTDGENGLLNPLGVNCLRNFPVYGNIAWGSRTLDGDDRLASEWKYIPVRRLALFLEESLYRGTQWVVFEPNDEPLWAQIRLNLGAFMNNLFRQGAFQGTTPKEAYFVKCDKETTTQNDINLGIVNIIVGYAPLKPAEFVILKFQQIAGSVET